MFFIITPTAFPAEPLGRLFYTPAQRAQLDTARAQRDRRAPVSIAPDAEAGAPQGPDTVTYGGVVRRSDGKSTVWLNGKPVTERNATTGDVNVLGVRRDGAVAVTVPQGGRTASLRVGQSMDVLSGTIEEPYARRLTTPRPPDKPLAPVAASAAPPAAASKPVTRSARERNAADEIDPDSGAAPPVERSPRK